MDIVETGGSRTENVKECEQMVDFGGLADKAKDALGQHGDKVSDGIDKAADFAKDKFSGHSDKIDSVADKAKGFVDSQGGDHGGEHGEQRGREGQQ